MGRGRKAERCQLLQQKCLLFSEIFIKKRLALERAKKLAYNCSSRDSGGAGTDKEVALSLADGVFEHEQETEE